jgi:hypothetical protein
VLTFTQLVVSKNPTTDITLWTNDLYGMNHQRHAGIQSRCPHLATVRRVLSTPRNLEMSRHTQDGAKILLPTINRLINVACYTA